MLSPPYKTYRGNFNYYPMKIGDHVHIGAGSVIEAATVGNHVEIGKNCVIVRYMAKSRTPLLTHHYTQGKFTIIKDCAKIADNTILPPNTVVPALSLFSGSPGNIFMNLVLFSETFYKGQFMEDLPETTQEVVEAYTKLYYNRFQPAES